MNESLTIGQWAILIAIPLVFGVIFPLVSNHLGKRRQEREAAAAAQDAELVELNTK